MSRLEDDAWEELVRQMEIDIAAADVPRAEKEVHNVVPHYVSPAWIESMVARTVDATSIPTKRRRGHRLLLAASVLLLCMLTAGATVAVLIWPERRNSDTTMSYQQQVALVLATVPMQDGEESRMAALGWIGDRVDAGIRTLLAIRQHPESSAVLAAQAHERLRGIEQLLGGLTTRSGNSVRDDQLSLMARAVDPQRNESERLACIQALAEVTMDNVGIIQRMGDVTPRLSEARGIMTFRLLKRLR